MRSRGAGSARGSADSGARVPPDPSPRPPVRRSLAASTARACKSSASAAPGIVAQPAARLRRRRARVREHRRRTAVRSRASAALAQLRRASPAGRQHQQRPAPVPGRGAPRIDAARRLGEALAAGAVRRYSLRRPSAAAASQPSRASRATAVRTRRSVRPKGARELDEAAQGDVRRRGVRSHRRRS